MVLLPREFWLLKKVFISKLFSATMVEKLLSPHNEHCKWKYVTRGIGYPWAPFTLATIGICIGIGIGYQCFCFQTLFSHHAFSTWWALQVKIYDSWYWLPVVALHSGHHWYWYLYWHLYWYWFPVVALHTGHHPSKWGLGGRSCGGGWLAPTSPH